MSRFDLSVEEWKIIQPVPRGVRFAWPALASMFMTDGSWTPSSIGGNAPLAMVMDKAYGCARIRRAVTDEGALSLPPPLKIVRPPTCSARPKSLFDAKHR